MLSHFSTISLIHVITALAALFTIALLWKFRKLTEVKFLIFLELFIFIWSFTYAAEFNTPDLNSKIFWSKISYLGIVFIPVCYFFFTTAYSQKKKFITSKNFALLSVIPVLTIALVFTNEWHQLIWSSVSLDPIENIAHYSHGFAFWIFYVYTETLLLLGLYNLVHSIYYFSAYYKKQISTLLVATLIPIAGNLIYITNINPFPGFDWTPVSFVLTGLIIALGIVRFQMFNIVPLARTKLFEMMNDGVLIVNKDGFIEDFNSSVFNIFNLQKKSILQESFYAVFGQYKKLIDGLSKNKASIQLEISHFNRKNYYQVKFSPIYRESKLSGHILIFHDITTIINADEELKKTNRKLVSEIEKREKLIEDLDAFAHTVAHDLRNSLSSIFSASEIMEEIIKLNDKNLLCELSNLINHSANKSIQITHELLLLATTDKTEVERKPLDMALIFDEAKKQMADLLKNSNAEIKEPDHWPTSLGYAPWIEEVWSNYISNAVKYGGTPPKIEVGADILHNGKVCFWVKDNGKGLSKDEQNRLFKKFVRLHPQRADGYGLGLSIVKKIIEKLEGKVGVENNKDGNGSKFYFVLPTEQNKSAIGIEKFHKNSSFIAN